MYTKGKVTNHEHEIQEGEIDFIQSADHCWYGKITVYADTTDEVNGIIESILPELNKTMKDKYLISLSTEEIVAIQKLLGHVLYHTSPELYSVALRLEQISDTSLIDYDSVVFYKHNHDGSPGKKYKKRKFAIGIE